MSHNRRVQFTGKKRRSLEVQIENLKGQVEALEEQIENLKGQVEALEDQNKELTDLLDSNEIQECELKQELEDLTSVSRQMILEKETLEHRVAESDNIRGFPIRKTVEYYNQFVSDVYNLVLDDEDEANIRLFVGAYEKSLRNRLKSLGYKIYAHERGTVLDSNYPSDEPTFEDCNDPGDDYKVKRCDLFGIDFPDHLVPRISSKITLYRFDGIVEQPGDLFLQIMETPSDLEQVLLLLYESVDSIDFNPHSLQNDGHVTYDTDDLETSSDWMDYYKSDMNVISQSLHGSSPVSMEGILEILLKGNRDVYLRVALSTGLM